MKLTAKQKYSIASSLSTSSVEATVRKIASLGMELPIESEAVAFVYTIDKHFKKRDGFIPAVVVKLCR